MSSLNQNKVFIIAEAGVNHNGSLSLAKQMVDRAVESGVDAIKFQSFKTEQLVIDSAPKANYQLNNTGINESQFQMLKKLELSQNKQQQLYNYCLEKNISFLSSPFDMESCHFLIETLGLKTIKLGSGELTNTQMLYYIGSTGVDIILSTGMSDIEEIEYALAVLSFAYTNNGTTKPSSEQFKKSYSSTAGSLALKQHVSLLHCTTEYPCPVQEVNLNVINALSTRFSLPIGYSDHTQDYHISIAAVALGSKIIEKHFTLDQTMSGPDHKSSIEAKELTHMVTQIRDIEKALGSPIKQMTQSEKQNRSIVRKGLYANGKINKGDILSKSNIIIKRPEAKLSAQYYWDILGTMANNNYQTDEPIDEAPIK